MSFNAFDFDETEASKCFQQSALYGTSPDLETTDEFWKKSMASANMNTVKFSDDSISGNLIGNKIKDDLDVKSSPSTLSARVRSNTTNISKPVKFTSEISGRQGGQNTKLVENRFAEKSVSEKVVARDNNSNITRENLDRSSGGSDYMKSLRKELDEARRMIAQLKNEKWKTLPPKDTIIRIVNGDPFVLDGYKSLADKVELLKAAVKCSDGNAIIAVIIFLERTLSAKIFLRELRKYPVAINHYIQHFRSNGEWNKLEELYNNLFLVEDAAVLRYERINEIKDVRERVIGLHTWLNDYGVKAETSEIKEYVYEEMKLLEKQQQLEEETRSKDPSDVIPNIALSSLLKTISFCASHHYEKGAKHHPDELKKSFNVHGKQFEWSVFVPLANRHRWTDIQDLFLTSNWFGKKSTVSDIGFENIVTHLHKVKAGEEILSKYASLIPNVETRIEYATKFSLHDVVIDTFVQLRDRRRMEEYRLTIGDSSSKHVQKIIDLLHNTSIKWR